MNNMQIAAEFVGELDNRQSFGDGSKKNRRYYE